MYGHFNVIGHIHCRKLGLESECNFDVGFEIRIVICLRQCNWAIKNDDLTLSFSIFKRTISAVAFTMKAKKKEKPALKTRTALLYESSDEDEDST